MKEYIIDSSAAIKWLFREPGSVEAEKILQRFIFFYSPDLFLIEMDSVITKKVRQRKLDVGEATYKRRQVRKLPYKIIRNDNVTRLSFE